MSETIPLITKNWWFMALLYPHYIGDVAPRRFYRVSCFVPGGPAFGRENSHHLAATWTEGNIHGKMGMKRVWNSHRLVINSGCCWSLGKWRETEKSWSLWVNGQRLPRLAERFGLGLYNPHPASQPISVPNLNMMLVDRYISMSLNNPILHQSL